jgi:hypothetical protein
MKGPFGCFEADAAEKRSVRFQTAPRPLSYSTKVLDVIILVAHRNG